MCHKGEAESSHSIHAVKICLLFWHSVWHSSYSLHLHCKCINVTNILTLPYLTYCRATSPEWPKWSLRCTYQLPYEWELQMTFASVNSVFLPIWVQLILRVRSFWDFSAADSWSVFHSTRSTIFGPAGLKNIWRCYCLKSAAFGQFTL